ncbi:unnamed protein product [Gordionus sp. m RMFG-2023]
MHLRYFNGVPINKTIYLDNSRQIVGKGCSPLCYDQRKTRESEKTYCCNTNYYMCAAADDLTTPTPRAKKVSALNTPPLI